jgi:hypothetical protein
MQPGGDLVNTKSKEGAVQSYSTLIGKPKSIMAEPCKNTNDKVSLTDL